MNKLVEGCPCGFAVDFNHCCGRYINPTVSMQLVPQTAEELMRSRYTAYVMGDGKYLSQTWHHTTRPTKMLSEQAQTKWVDLTIINTINGKSDDRDGVVEFVARCKINGKMMKLHEKSRFIKEDGQWFYLA